jgi:uncharacterized protein YhbP (UPF0306 family)
MGGKLAMKPESYIMKILDEMPLMQLATVGDNQPWVVSVYFAMDNQHNLYWMSRDTRRHSKLITDNPKVAATVHMPYVVGDPGRAVQLEGTARAIPAEESGDYFQAYAERYRAHAMLPELLDPQSPHTLYQLTPMNFVLFDEANFPDSPRQDWTPLS